jgi:hypothetical protein
MYYIYRCIYQWRSFKVGPSDAKFLRKGTEIIPRKHSHTRIACELHKTNAKLALSRAASARRALFRLPIGASDEMRNDEIQTDLPATVADRSSYRDRQRHSRNAWTSRFRARHSRPPT